MPQNLEDLALFAVDASGLDLSKLTASAGGLRDASGQLIRLARPISKDVLEQASKSMPRGPQAAAVVGIAGAVVGAGAIGFAVAENRDVIGRKARDTWRKVRGICPEQRSFDPWQEAGSDQSEGCASASRDFDANDDSEAPRHTPHS